MSRLRPSPAMVVAFIALIVSITGGAYAATTIANRSIVNRMLADNSVWHRNIGTGSVRSVNIARGTIEQHNMAANSVWNAQIGTGSVRANNVNASLLTAGGDLTGKYPDPAIANGAVTDAKLSPALLAQITAETAPASTAFGSTATIAMPKALTTTPETVATGDITTTEAEKSLVLNGYVQVNRPAPAGLLSDTITCTAALSGKAEFATVTVAQPSGSAPRQFQVALVGRATGLTPGTHTINVDCAASVTGYQVVGAEFTGIATG